MAFRALVAGLILLFSLSSPAHAVVPELRQPAWAELTLEQKQILAPLARDWDRMEALRKKKWLGIAKRYPTMKPEEQARVQRRMQDWASLTPEQRTTARTQYKNLKTAPPEAKETLRKKWEQYKELPDEEKRRLAEKAASKPGAPRPLGLATKLPPQPLPAPAVSAPAPTPAPAPAPATAEVPAEGTQAEPPPSAEASVPPAAPPPTPSPPAAAQQQ